MKFIAFFDIHVGFETRHRPGKGARRVPAHDEKALAVAFEFAKSWNPDVFVLGGDQLHLAGVSRHTEAKNILREGHRLVRDYELLDKLVISRIDELAPRYKIWHDGNHEDWLYELLNKTPALEGLVMPSEYLRLRERGWIVKGSNDVTRIGKIAIMHGSAKRIKNPAREYAMTYRKNIRFGHYHTFQADSDIRPPDSLDYHTAIAVPALSRRAFDYTSNVPSRALQGFLAGEVDPETGFFNDFVLIINNYRVVFGGHIYEPSGRRPIDAKRPPGKNFVS